MRRLLLAALFATLAVSALADTIDEEPQECDPSPEAEMRFAESEQVKQVLSALQNNGVATIQTPNGGQPTTVLKVGSVPAGNPGNVQPFISGVGGVGQVANVVPPVTIIQKQARKPPCKKSSGTGNIKLKNNNQIQDITVPAGESMRKYMKLINGDSSSGGNQIVSSAKTSSTSGGKKRTRRGEKLAALARGQYGESAESSGRRPRGSERGLFSGSFSGESAAGESARQDSSRTFKIESSQPTVSGSVRSSESGSFKGAAAALVSGSAAQPSLASQSAAAKSASASSVAATSASGSVSLNPQSANAVFATGTTPLIDRRAFFLTQSRLFKVSIHFRPGIDSFKLFDYPAAPTPNDPNNLGAYGSEWQKFPDTWANMTKILNDVGIQLKKKKKIYLCIAGFASTQSGGQPEHYALSERRAAAAACYLAEWFRKQGMPNFAFKIGFYGSKYAKGEDPVSAAKDRRVDIFYALDTSAYKDFLPQFHWKGGSTIPKGGTDGGLSEYCKLASNWKSSNFEDRWIQYAGLGKFPTGSSSGSIARLLGSKSGSGSSQAISPEVFEDVVFTSASGSVPASLASIGFGASKSGSGAAKSGSGASSRRHGQSGSMVASASVSGTASKTPAVATSASVGASAQKSAVASQVAVPSSVQSAVSQPSASAASQPSAASVSTSLRGVPTASGATAPASTSTPSALQPSQPRGPLIQLQNSNHAISHENDDKPKKKRRRRRHRGFVYGRPGTAQKEGSKTVFASPIA